MSESGRGRLKNLVRSDYFLSFLIILVWTLALTFMGLVFERLLTTTTIPNPFLHKDSISVVSHTLRWDSGWFLAVTKDFYVHNAPSAAFYPLFPLLAVVVHKLSLGLLSLPVAGFLINFIAAWLAFCALLKITKLLLKDNVAAWCATLLFIAFPSAFFLHSFYSEALFCALGFWAYYFALKRKWIYTGLLLGALSATRLTAILFIGLCVLEYLRSCNWKLSKIRANILWLGLSMTGFIAYGAYLQNVRHNFFAMFSAYKATNDWNYQIFNPNIFYTYARFGYDFLLVLFGSTPITNGSLANVLMPFPALTVLGLASLVALYKIRKYGIPLGLFGLVSIVLFTLNSNITSGHRYVLPTLTLYIVFGWLVATYRQTKPWVQYIAIGTIALSLILQVFLYNLFTAGFFAG